MIEKKIICMAVDDEPPAEVLKKFITSVQALELATELQLLKTSIHPRFLFHSLHTVKKHINSSSAQSPALTLQLSDLLSYILYEKDESWVELEKELEIIRHYVHLEERGFENNRLFKTEYPCAGLHYLEVIAGDKYYSIDLKLPLYSGDLINSRKNALLNEVPIPV